MAYYRKCRGCQCSLDPGEGIYCDTCIAKMEREEKHRQVLANLFMEMEDGQMIIGGLNGGR